MRKIIKDIEHIFYNDCERKISYKDAFDKFKNEIIDFSKKGYEIINFNDKHGPTCFMVKYEDES